MSSTRIAFLGLMLAGCSLVRLTANATANVLEVAAPAFSMESDVELVRQAAPGQLKMIEGFLLAVPDNRKLLSLLARGYYEYAFGFVENDIEESEWAGRTDEAAKFTARATDFYWRSMRFGLRLLTPDWERDLHGVLPTFEKRVKRAQATDVPGMFWTGLGLLSAINLNRDNIEWVVLFPQAILLLQRVIELDESYYFGSAHVALGMVCTAQATAVGGDPERGKKHFQRTIELNQGKFLMPKVLMAFHYGTIVQDRTFFRRTLEEVLKTPADIWPEQRLANELAHLKAERYLVQVERYF